MAEEVLIPIATYSIDLLKGLLEKILDVDRKIAISIANYCPDALTSPKLYFESGTSDNNLVREIPSQEVFLWGAHKSESTARGSVGVMSFKFPNANKTLLLMWSVPFDYNLYSNWWNATVVDGDPNSLEQAYNDLYNGTNGMPYPHKPDNWSEDIVEGFKLVGSMTNNGHALLEFQIHPE